MCRSDHKCCCCCCQPEPKKQDEPNYTPWIGIIVFAILMGLASGDQLPGLSLSSYPADPSPISYPVDSIP